MKLAKLLILILILLIPFSVNAQQVIDFQTRPIGHVQYDLNKKLFVAGWVIGNGQYYGTSNINILGGLGYRGKDWWLESMIQRQWSEKDRKLLWDSRFQQKFRKSSLYVEVAPFLDRRAVYDMVVFEKLAWRNLNFRLETENIHKSGRDSLGVGPGVGWSFGSLGSVKVNGAVIYQFRRQETDVLRFYAIFNHRFKK
ncbi:MAG: hypothetical protein AAB784_02435 [Patescibacteria group bacterium]